MVGIESKYGFPLFTKDHSTEYLVKNERLRVSDIWAFWNYIIRMYKNKNSKVNKDFLLSLLDQAQYFYNTAENAPIRSQPLLYYYSFLNFVKIVVNFENYQGEGKSYMHGVKHIGVNPSSKLSSMKVGIHALGGTHIQVCPQFMTLMGDSIPALGAGVTYDLGIKDLLKSCIGIHRTYCETFNMKEEYVRIEDIQLWRDGKNLTFKALIPKCNPTLMAQLNAAGYHVVDEVQVDGVTHLYYWTENIVMASYSPTRQNLYDLSCIVRNKGIWYYTDGTEYRVYVTAGSTRIRTESIIYNLMFFFGSITRYYPFLFDSLLSEKELWIISEFLNTQPMQFLHLVTSKVIGAKILKPRTMNIV